MTRCCLRNGCNTACSPLAPVAAAFHGEPTHGDGAFDIICKCLINLAGHHVHSLNVIIMDQLCRCQFGCGSASLTHSLAQKQALCEWFITHRSITCLCTYCYVRSLMTWAQYEHKKAHPYYGTGMVICMCVCVIHVTGIPKKGNRISNKPHEDVLMCNQISPASTALAQLCCRLPYLWWMAIKHSVWRQASKQARDWWMNEPVLHYHCTDRHIMNASPKH